MINEEAVNVLGNKVKLENIIISPEGISIDSEKKNVYKTREYFDCKNPINNSKNIFDFELFKE